MKDRSTAAVSTFVKPLKVAKGVLE